ncbi:MAG: two-component regulator propeller domain-containing protein [Bacteroidota bacterium]
MYGGIRWISLFVVLAVGWGTGRAVAQGPVVQASGQTSGTEGEAWTPRFERAHDVEPYLPQSSVYDILEDRRGFLWFGTREGLGRWDGYTMRTWRFEPFDVASLPGNQVRQIEEDAHGDLWVRAERTDRSPVGVARLVGPDHERVERYGHHYAALFVGPDGEAWLADSTFLWRFDRTAGQFAVVRDRLTPHRADDGWSLSGGAVWVGTPQGIEQYTPTADGGYGASSFVRADRTWWSSEDLLFKPFNALAEDAGGRVWVGGVHLGYVEEGRMVTLETPSPNVAGSETGLDIIDMIPTPEALWLATLDGVYHFDLATQTFTRFSLRLPGDIATQNWVTALHRDRTGTFWAGTVWGLHRASPFISPFRLFAHNPDDPNTIGSGIVLSVEEDPAGALWVGTLGGGLNRIDPAGSVTRYRHEPDDPRSLWQDWVWSVEADADTVWVGTGGGLNAIPLDEPGEISRIRHAGPLHDAWGSSAMGLHLDAAGTLWYGHPGGLHRRHPDGTVAVTPLPEGSMGLQQVRTVPGGAWITTTDGLLFYDMQADAFEVYRHRASDPTSIPDDATVTLHLDRKGQLWVGTQSGLARRDPGSDGFVQFSTADGLPSSTVYTLLEAEDGTLWVSTNRGLARYDEGQVPAFRAYALADGVGNVEFNRHAAAVGRDGTFYFGGDRGVTAFHPEAVRLNPHPPPIVVTALHRATQDSTMTERHVAGAPVRIAPDVSTFAFEFAALAFTNPHRNQYAVQMEGWDDAWVPMGNQRRATYTNLPPGRYTFRVRAANEDGVWNETGVAVPVVVAPWFWQTVWFQLLLGIALVGLVAFVAWSFSHRAYQRRLAQMEAQQALERERARISRDMHDEVGASLTEIAILSELAQLHAAQPHHNESPGGDGAPAALPPAAAGRLQQIAATSRATLDAIGQIVWALNPRNDRLDHLVAYLRESAAQALEPTGLDVVLRFPESVPPRSVTTEFRRNVFLVLREAVHNLVKHAGAQRVTVTVTVTGEALTLTVEDDGQGFASGRRFGNGLGNMRERAEEIGGALTVESELGAGTRIRLAAPLPVEV